MWAVLVAIFGILFNLFVILGVLATVTPLALGIVNIVLFVIIALLCLLPAGPFPWHHA